MYPGLPTASSQIHPPQPTGDPKRDKARSLLADALRAALHDVGGADVGQVAGDVERAALEQAGGEVSAVCGWVGAGEGGRGV